MMSKAAQRSVRFAVQIWSSERFEQNAVRRKSKQLRAFIEEIVRSRRLLSIHEHRARTIIVKIRRGQPRGGIPAVARTASARFTVNALPLVREVNELAHLKIVHEPRALRALGLFQHGALADRFESQGMNCLQTLFATHGLDGRLHASPRVILSSMEPRRHN